MQVTVVGVNGTQGLRAGERATVELVPRLAARILRGYIRVERIGGERWTSADSAALAAVAAELPDGPLASAPRPDAGTVAVDALVSAVWSEAPEPVKPARARRARVTSAEPAAEPVAEEPPTEPVDD